MIVLQLEKLLANLSEFKLSGAKNPEITIVTVDSRQVREGGLFVAVPGFQTDGHKFIDKALAQGAKAIVLEQDRDLPEDVAKIQVTSSRQALADLGAAFYNYPAGQLRLIGVTGTNGKTTTTTLIANILRLNSKVGLIGTTANYIGDRKLPVTHTTPESIELQELLAEMVQAKLEFAIMEVSSHALELERVRGLNFEVAVFTNLTQDHLDFHHSMEAYAQAKAKLFAGLQAPAQGVVNGDDPWVEKFLQICSVPVMVYGLSDKAQVRALAIQVQAKGVSFILQEGDKQYPVNLQLTGLFNVYNALAAYCVGRCLKLEPEAVIAALEGVVGIDGRFQAVERGQDFAVIVDYAHTPDGLENILKTARQILEAHPGGRLITVFGCGGDRDRGKRPKMGAIACRLSDFVWITSDNPRTEDPEQIIQDIVAGVPEGSATAVEIDRKKAIEKALAMAKSGDIVMLAGKGHEDYQILGTQKHHFDDREIAAAWLEKYQELK